MTLPAGEALRRSRERDREYARKKWAARSSADKEALRAVWRERGRGRYTDPAKRLERVRTKKKVEQRKLREGICVSCVEPATCTRYCFKHWLLSVGRKYGLKLKNGGVEMLKALWEEQNGMCALTGDLLIPGHNASIDHIVPRCRNGGNEKSNLQWVTKDVNKFKFSRNNEELIRMSVKIAQHASRIERSNVIPLVRKSASEV